MTNYIDSLCAFAASLKKIFLIYSNELEIFLVITGILMDLE